MGKFISLLIVLALITVGVGFYRGWFTFATTQEQGGKQKVSVEVDTGKIKSDAKTVEQSAKNLSQSVIGNKTVKGTIVKVDASSFTVMTADNHEMLLQMEADSKVHLPDRDGQLANLRAGDQVTVAYHEKEGKELVRSVTVEKVK